MTEIIAWMARPRLLVTAPGLGVRGGLPVWGGWLG